MAVLGLLAAVAIGGPCAASPPPAALPAATPPARIRSIRIECADVFGDAEHSSVLYRTADALHIKTRPEFVRRELLFAEGDSLDIARLRETERNLRQYKAFRSAAIRFEPVGPGAVDVVVSTADAWTTGVGAAASSTGGRFRFAISGEESNFLGSGRDVAFKVDSGPDRLTREISYGDPQLFGHLLTLGLQYASSSDGGLVRGKLARPFNSLETPWAGSIGLEQTRGLTRLYDGGQESAAFDFRTRRGAVEVGRLVSRPGSRRVVRLFGGYRREEVLFHGPAAPRMVGVADATKTPLGAAGTGDPPGDAGAAVPQDRRFGYVVGRLEIGRPNFITERNVNRLSRQEDFDVGSGFTAELGVSPPIFGAERGATGALTLSRGRRYARGFLLGTFTGQGRYQQGRIENAVIAAQIFGVLVPGAWPRGRSHTLVGRFESGAGWHLDGETQLAADGNTGLRGYALHAFTGDRRVIVNLEDRIVLTPELAHVVQLGGALFTDAGYAWARGDPLAFEDLRVDVGAGLRLGMPRASHHSLWRFDASYALRPDLLGRQGWLYSFSSTQAF